MVNEMQCRMCSKAVRTQTHISTRASHSIQGRMQAMHVMFERAKAVAKVRKQQVRRQHIKEKQAFLLYNSAFLL